MNANSAAIIEVTRGGHPESTHQVDIVAIDADGAVVDTWGDSEGSIFPRSSVKALQALPLIESGAADAYAFGGVHLALACSSHHGEPCHVSTAQDMLGRIGLDEKCLECGAQIPENPVVYRELLNSGQTPTAIHNVCSGKHSGFLALAAHQNLDHSGYIDVNHPVQREIAGVLENLLETPHTKENCGIDGCSIPTYKVPLAKLAGAFARFCVGKNQGAERSKAMLRLRDACMKNPQYVAGTGGFCTNLMSALPGRVFGKYGAEGVYMLGLPELGFGIALKARDGTARAVEVAAANMVTHYLDLNEAETARMAGLIEPEIRNKNEFVVGSLKMV